MKMSVTILICLGSLFGCQEKKKEMLPVNLQVNIKHQNNEQLSTFIDSLYSIDQKVQNDVVEAFQNGVGSDSIKVLFAKISIVYQRHTHLLKKIIKNHGYPDPNIVGKTSSHHFFIMVQHSDADVAFQSDMLKYITKEVEKGNIVGKDFAFLTDRVLLAKGKQQLYGTQVEYELGKRAFPKNLYKPEECNERRSKLKMGTLEDYLEFVLEQHKKQNQISN